MCGFNLPAEYLRVFSPSAEVRGHGKGQEVLQFGKRLVRIEYYPPSLATTPSRSSFDDGHDSGILYLGLSLRPRVEAN